MALSDRIVALTNAIAVAVNARAGKVGASAYELAALNGYAGTQAQWIAQIPGAQRFTTLAAMNAAVATAPQGMLFALGSFTVANGTTAALKHRFSVWQVLDNNAAVPITPILLESGTGTPAARITDCNAFKTLVGAQSALYLYPQSTKFIDNNGNEFYLNTTGSIRVWTSEWQNGDNFGYQGPAQVYARQGRFRYAAGRVIFEGTMTLNAGPMNPALVIGIPVTADTYAGFPEGNMAALNASDSYRTYFLNFFWNDSGSVKAQTVGTPETNANPGIGRDVGGGYPNLPFNEAWAQSDQVRFHWTYDPA